MMISSDTPPGEGRKLYFGVFGTLTPSPHLVGGGPRAFVPSGLPYRGTVYLGLRSFVGGGGRTPCGSTGLGGLHVPGQYVVRWVPLVDRRPYVFLGPCRGGWVAVFQRPRTCGQPRFRGRLGMVPIL